MRRELEPEVMDDANEALIYDSMDHSAANEAFVSDLLNSPLDAQHAEILDLGTGTGQIPLELCQRVSFPRVTGIDLSESMLDLARCHVEAAGLTERIRFDLVDAKRLIWKDSSFDAVISNSIVHHIPEPASALHEAARVVRAGGLLFFRDLMRPESAEIVERLVSQYTGTESEYAQRLFRESLHAALDLSEIRDLVERIGFSPDSVYASSDRHWTWCATRP